MNDNGINQLTSYKVVTLQQNGFVQAVDHAGSKQEAETLAARIRLALPSPATKIDIVEVTEKIVGSR